MKGATITSSDVETTRAADLELARRAAAGDRAALHDVVERHARGLFHLARKLCPTAADAEDVVQETLLAAFRGIGRFDGRASLMTWMCRILARRAGRSRQRRQRDQAASLDAGGDGLVASPERRATGTVDSRLDLAAALPKLVKSHREVIVLRELQGLSYAEIATVLNIPQGTVESRLHRARQELRAHLRGYEA